MQASEHTIKKVSKKIIYLNKNNIYDEVHKYSFLLFLDYINIANTNVIKL